MGTIAQEYSDLSRIIIHNYDQIPKEQPLVRLYQTPLYNHWVALPSNHAYLTLKQVLVPFQPIETQFFMFGLTTQFKRAQNNPYITILFLLNNNDLSVFFQHDAAFSYRFQGIIKKGRISCQSIQQSLVEYVTRGEGIKYINSLNQYLFI